MTAESRENPYADLVSHINGLLYPQGEPAEMQTLESGSLEDTAQLFADEFQEPRLTVPLAELLHDFQRSNVVDGVGLVALRGNHLSVRVMANLSGLGEGWQNPYPAIREIDRQFVASVRAAMPHPPVSVGLSFMNTTGMNATELLPQIIDNVRREMGATLTSFVTFAKPTPTAQV